MNESRDSQRLKQFGIHLRKLRLDQNLSLDQVVANCDVTKANLSNIENGKKDFNFSTLLEIAKGLNISIQKLMSDWES